ncbi:hypothetical protein SETIT_8G052700v2 [Setaria italica]|uniref:Uncharacterized protein n=1 Tax=Setaria italica TaxID=4555 RepID=A0A368S4F5_SETIT|nr:hypothetical protein SETIT_8G052700v2 [Setaria italica]
MLNRYGIRMDDSFVADAKTVAYSRTFTGQHLRVSFGRAPPPASSFIYYDFPDIVPGEEDDDVDECEGEDDVDELHIGVIAAHGDSVLLKMSHRRLCNFEDDHFLYRAGAASSPAMSLLPDRDFLTKSEQVYADCIVSPPIRPIVHSGTTGLLQRGDDDVLLVELDLLYDRSLRREMAEFCLLRHGTSQRELKEPVPIIQDEGSKGVEQPRRRCGIDTIIPLGDRFLCWVTYESGFLLCDMADEAGPKVRYVPLPNHYGKP